MDIFINNKSGLPIYEQIYQQLKKEILVGNLKENEALPSIRNLAKDLHISVITTKRAYDELEKEGFIYTIAAKGCFVAAKNIELIKEENLKLIEDHLNEVLKLASICNLSKSDIVNILDCLEEE